MHKCALIPQASREAWTIGYRNRGPVVCPSPRSSWSRPGVSGNPNDARQVKAGKVCELESLRSCIRTRPRKTFTMAFE